MQMELQRSTGPGFDSRRHTQLWAAAHGEHVHDVSSTLVVASSSAGGHEPAEESDT